MPNQPARGSSNYILDFLPVFLLLILFLSLIFVQEAIAPGQPSKGVGPVIFLPLVAIVYWWLMIPWAGWGPLLVINGLLQCLVLGDLRLQLGTLTAVHLPAIIICIQHGYFSYWKPGWRQTIRTHVLFDERVARHYPWLCLWHPASIVLTHIRRWWPPALQDAYNQLKVVNAGTRRPLSMAEQCYRLSWPPAIFIVGPALAWIIIIYLSEFFVVPDAVNRAVSWFWNNNVLIPRWFLLLPWLGWLSLIGMLIMSFFFQPHSFVPFLIASAVILAQKGYFSRQPNWGRMLVSNAIIDTRITEQNPVLNYIHPAMIGAKYLPKLAARLSIKPQLTRTTWWIFVLLYTVHFFFPDFLQELHLH